MRHIMTNELTVIDKLDNFLLESEPSFLALNETVNHLNFKAECGFARQSLMRNDYLLGVARKNQQSLADAISNVAAIGISLNPANKQAYLVPRKIKTGAAVCLDISYMGMIRLATDTGVVKYMKAELVYENDVFTYNGFDTRPEIAVSNPFDVKSRGLLIGCIAWAKLNSGDYLNEFMNIEQINKIRNDSEAYKGAFGEKGSKWKQDNCVWVKHEGEMQKKTVIKRLYKTLPSSDGSDIMSKAIDVINEHEGIEFKEPPKKDYTQDQSDAYLKALDDGDYVGLLCVMESLEYEGQHQLFTLHEEPRKIKGQKMKYDSMMKSALANARDVRDESLNQLMLASDNGDDITVLESTEDANQYTIDWYCSKLNSEQEQFIRSTFEVK